MLFLWIPAFSCSFYFNVKLLNVITDLEAGFVFINAAFGLDSEHA